MNRLFLLCVIQATIVAGFGTVTLAQNASGTKVLNRENLVAWCIVPFDGKHRGPAQRAQMIADLGLRRVAYDWRQEHVPTFEQEIIEYNKRGLEYFAFWSVHEEAFKLFEKYNLHPQIWQIIPEPTATTQEMKVQAAAEQLLPLVHRSKGLGSKLGLYNHGGWSGEPENLVAVCQYLRKHHDADHVGIVYNLHHAHDVVDRFADVIQAIKPYLLCLNLNGMTADGEANGQKILPLGAGELDLSLLQAIHQSGYSGPIGIIGHTQDDVQLRLQDNLDGFDWLVAQLDGQPAGAKPSYRTWNPPQADASDSGQYSPQRVADLIAQARNSGNAHRGLVVFGSATSACLSCHKLGDYGGTVGPDLLNIAPRRKPEELIESVLWPARHIEPQYLAHRVVTNDGTIHRGYVVERNDQRLVLNDPAKGKDGIVTIESDAIELESPSGTLMPDNLLMTMTNRQTVDLLRFLLDLGRPSGISVAEMNAVLMHANIHSQGPATFQPDRKPLNPTAWPSWEEPVNRGRVYDFYSKQADHFRAFDHLPPLLTEYPGLDGGKTGHWGNQDEATWSSNLWNEIKLGSVQCGVFRGGNVTVPRGVCVRLGDQQELSACFNPETLTYDAIWKDGFLKFSTVRHGFMDGVIMAGTMVDLPEQSKPTLPLKYHGYYRVGPRVIFSYRIGDQDYLDSPWVKDGQFVRQLAKADLAADRAAGLPLDALDLVGVDSGPDASIAQWPESFETSIQHGDASPYAIDTIGLPAKNPWKSTFFFGGHDIANDGSAIVCTMRGDVWRVSDLEFPSTNAVWRRIASGLHQPLGVVVDQDGIFILGRDQITRLHDRNGDGEADYYECFSNQYLTSIAGHDFICGLQRDRDGNFYTASGNQGVVRISADGTHGEVVATGFRNPDGLGVTPDGILTVPCSEGEWTPASMICAVNLQTQVSGAAPPYFGYPGPRDGQPPQLPLVYLPRGLDNSAGGQIGITSDRWGPLQGQCLHFSFGTGAHFLLLRDEVAGQLQGAVVPLPGEFRSGAHRGRFSPVDGQLYVTGMQGWGSYTTDGGCFQRVRYTGETVQLPTRIRAHQNGVALEFSSQLDPELASQTKNHFAQCWNYRYSSAYGSPEFSTKHMGVKGHDVLAIEGAHVGSDGATLFLEIPDIQPVNQLHLRIQTNHELFRDIFATVHMLDKPFTDYPGYQPSEKRIARHPMLTDLAMATKRIPNPHQAELAGARAIRIETGSNLTFQTSEFHAQPNEPIALTLDNTDVVPHNWALVKPGHLEKVGGIVNRMISDPDAAMRHYVPATSDVLTYTDVVLPQEKFTIYFRAPSDPGRYPYLCTFPGHWPVMNGVMVVDPAKDD